MILSLPWIVILAGLFYFVASRAGWLESFARWRGRSRPSGGKPRRPPPAVNEPPSSSQRLEVFEEFLRNLGRDDAGDSDKPDDSSRT